MFDINVVIAIDETRDVEAAHQRALRIGQVDDELGRIVTDVTLEEETFTNL